MKLSVCIFTYNHVKFINETIDSVLKQKTNFDFEIVIGDDCSTDGTVEIIKNYQKNYPGKINAYFNDNNLGLMKNNANTILRCQGEYIALLDGDDYWTFDNKLQVQVDFLNKNQEYIFCFHDGSILNGDGKLHDDTCCSNIKNSIVTFTDIIYDVSIPTFSIVFRKSSLKEYPPKWFYSLNAPDRPLFLLLSAQGPGYYFDKCWAVYRKHNTGSWTGQNFQSRWLTHLQIYKVINKHFEKKYDNEFCKCESKVVYILAMRLLRDKKIKRAKCYFRRFRKINNNLVLSAPGIYFKTLNFIYFYCKTVLTMK